MENGLEAYKKLSGKTGCFIAISQGSQLVVSKLLTGIVLGLFLFVVSCSNDTLSDQFDDDFVIAVINKEEVSLDQFKAELQVHKRQFRVKEEREVEQGELLWLKNRALQQIVQNTLFKQEAKKNNIGVSQEELDEALLKTQVGYAEDSFNNQLEFEGLSRKEWKSIIESNLLIKKLINNIVNSKVSISNDVMRHYFQSHEASFHKREQVRALHIMVETEEEIRQIQKELQSKQKDFSLLAKEYSLGPEGVRGGDLGYFEAGQMPEEFDNVFKLKINSVSDIIHTPYGFHLFKVVDKVGDRKMSFDESKKQVEQTLLQELQSKAFQKWLTQLKDKSVIDINYAFLEKID
jgi:parvulin-like peptidyl-prolyl isomerase